MNKIARDLFLSLLVIFLILPNNAHAYLDPGAGSMIIQYIAAMLFASLFIVKSFWRQIKAFFESLFGKKIEEKEDKKNKEISIAPASAVKKDEKTKPKKSKNKKR